MTSSIKNLNLYEVLETLAYQQAATASTTVGGFHSRLARVLPDSWQARMFRDSADLRHVTSAADLAVAMGEAHSPILFIGNDVTIDAAAIARICGASGQDKTIIWEDGGLA